MQDRISADVKLWALLNATFQSGMANPLDEAIASSASEEDRLPDWTKVDEIPTTSCASVFQSWCAGRATTRI